MNTIAVALILLTVSVHGQLRDVKVLTAHRGTSVGFLIDEPFEEDEFSCFKDGVKVAPDKNRHKKYDRDHGESSLFVIINVEDRDHGRYVCGYNETRKFKSYSLVVVGPISMKVEKLMNHVDVQCKVDVFTVEEDERLLSLEFQVGNEVKSKIGITKNDTMNPRTMKFSGRLDKKIKVQDLTCALRAETLYTNTTQQIDISYPVNVVIAKMGENAVFHSKGATSLEDFQCARSDKQVEFVGRLSKRASEGGMDLVLSSVTSEDFGEYLCYNSGTVQFDIFSLVVLEPTELDVKRVKNRVDVTCTGKAISEYGLDPKLHGLALQILVDKKEVKRSELFDDNRQFITLKYSGGSKSSVVTCTVGNKNISTSATDSKSKASGFSTFSIQLSVFFGIIIARSYHALN